MTAAPVFALESGILGKIAPSRQKLDGQPAWKSGMEMYLFTQARTRGYCHTLRLYCSCHGLKVGRLGRLRRLRLAGDTLDLPVTTKIGTIIPECCPCLSIYFNSPVN